MFEKIFRRQAYLIANAVFLLTLVVYFLSLFNHPFIGITLERRGPYWQVVKIDSYGQGYRSGIKRGQRVVSIDGQLPENFPSVKRWGEVEGAKSITVEGPIGVVKEISISQPPVTETLFSEIPMAVLGFVFWCVGYATWVKRPFLVQARSLYWLTWVIGFTIILASASSRDLLFARNLEYISFTLVPPLLINFISVFPRVSNNMLNTKGRKLLSLLSGLIIIGLALKSMGFLTITGEMRKLVLIEAIMGCLIALRHLVEPIRLPDNKPEKNQAMIVLAGLVLGIFPFAILTALPIIVQGSPVLNPRVSALFIVTIPVIWGYVIVNKYLPDGRWMLQLIVTYFIAGIIVALLLSCILWLTQNVYGPNHGYLLLFAIAIVIFAVMNGIQITVQRIMGKVAFIGQQEFRKKVDELNESLASINEDNLVGEIVKGLGLEGVLLIAEDYQGWYLRKAAGRFLEDVREQEMLETLYFTSKSRLESIEFLPVDCPAEVFMPFYSEDFFCGVFLGHRCSHVKFQSWELPELTALWNQVVQRLKASHVVSRLSREINTMAESIIQTQQKSRGLQTINKSLFRTLETEKKALSREIHDGPLQLGLEISRRLKQVSEDLPINLENGDTIILQDLIEDLNYELRAVCSNLRPSSLSDLGLVPAVETMCQQIMLKELLVISLEVQGIAREQRFAEECELGAFRFLQEGLNNVIKHSGSSKVEVRLELLDGKLSLMIKDSGKGFDVSKIDDWAVSGTHFGIIGMRERIMGLGGDFHIQAAYHKGVTLHAVVPIS